MTSVAVSADGKRIAAASSLDGVGELAVYGYEFDTSYPDKIKAINQKVVTGRSAAENAELEKYHKDGVREIARVKVPQGGIYAVAFRPDGKVLAAAGADGIIRLLNPEKGSTIKEFAPVTVRAALTAQNTPVSTVAPKQEEAVADRDPARGRQPVGARGPAEGGPPQRSIRLRPAPGQWTARLGRDG